MIAYLIYAFALVGASLALVAIVWRVEQSRPRLAAGIFTAALATLPAAWFIAVTGGIA